jgi:hypothetical protein
MEKLRIGGFGATLIVTAALLMSDWPLGFWHEFWIEHPLWAAVVGGFLLLLVTAFGLDAYVRRREARRWRVIGRVAAGEFNFGCSEAWVAMLALVGIAEISGQLSPSIQQRLDVARPVIDSYAPRLAEIPAAHQRERVVLLADDPRWGAAVSPVLNAVGIELANAVSRWSAALLTLQDEDMFTAIDRFGLVGTDISDLAHGLDPVLETRLEAAAAADLWMSLYVRFVGEGEGWESRFRGAPSATPSIGRRYDDRRE